MATRERFQSNDQLRDLNPVSTRKKGLLSGITPQHRFYWVRLLLENPIALASIIFLALISVGTFLVPAISSHEVYRTNAVDRLLEPSGEYWLGTDNYGRDVLVRTIYAARVSLLVGLAVMVIASVGGSIIGLLSGYYQRLDTATMRNMDGIMAFPPILLAIAIMASLGRSTVNVMIALGIVYMPIIARLVRGGTLTVKNQLYVEAARCIGATDVSILRKHIFLNALSPIIVQATFIVAFAIIAEASLSFLGAGVPPETPTWGNMLQEGQRLIQRAWWLVLFPGVLLFLTVLSLNLVGDGLRDAIDPRSRQR
jgi:peptide/nickel transport system permease protein